MAVRPLPMLWAHQNRTHRIGFALVRVRTPYPSFQMATQIGNIAQILDGAIDFYNKSPQEQGEALGKATVSVASDVAIAALTDGLGSVAALRKAEKVAEAADHVRDAERALHSSRHAVVPYDPRFAAQQILGETPVTPKGRMITTHAAERMTTPPIGRAKMTTAEVDDVLDKGDRIKKLSHHRDGDTITIQSTTMPGKPQVVVDAATGNRVITVIKNSK